MKKIASVILIMILLASASFSEKLLPADLSEGSRLVGLLITREDLSVYTGDAGILLASRMQTEADSDPEYIFGDVRGMRLICFMLTDASKEDSHVVSDVDDGFTAIDFDISNGTGSVSINAAISFVPRQEDVSFFFNPVLMAASGQVFAVPGDCMAVNAAMNPPGSSVGQSIRDERKLTENGAETIDTTSVAIQINAVREATEIRLLQFSEKHELLKSEAFLPGHMPAQIVPLAEADYLLLETVEKDGDGASFIRREAVSRDTDGLSTLSCRDDGICICHYHDVLWR